jgi:predicted dehydrogenase
MSKLKVGVIGCGTISGIYFTNLKSFSILEVVACADVVIERAAAKAAEFSIPKAYSVDVMLADPEVDIVINLTIPKVHAEISLQALRAGKHVYSEKPLAITREEGQQILQLAELNGLYVGCAPDTFLGGALQTCIKLINDGSIGLPVAATAFMVCPGHEYWHPDPFFYYQVGGGPLYDMGPYYLTALVAMLGPIRRVTGSTRISFQERTITSEPKFGQNIKVEVPTHISGILDFVNGAMATMITSFDVFGGSDLPYIEIYGSEGTLQVPDPNNYGGLVRIRHKYAMEWIEIPLMYGFTENSRGIAVADMAYAILEKRKHRANGEVAYHILEAICGIHDASEKGKHYEMQSHCSRPEAFPLGYEAKFR